MGTVLTLGAADGAAAGSRTDRKRNLLLRMVSSIIRTRQMKADHEIAKILARRGGRMNDVTRFQRVNESRTIPFPELPALNVARRPEDRAQTEAVDHPRRRVDLPL